MKTICLVGCGDKKLNRPAAPARDLYCSTYFKKKMEYAERNNLVWYVLSAKYGVLAPSQPTKNYNLSMTTVRRNASAVKLWQDMVFQQLDIIKPNEIVFLCGEEYLKPLLVYCNARKIKMKTPLQGLTIGYQMAFLSK